MVEASSLRAGCPWFAGLSLKPAFLIGSTMNKDTRHLITHTIIPLIMLALIIGYMIVARF